MRERNDGLWAGPALALLVVGLLSATGTPAPAAWTTGVTTLCVLWWVTEAIPIPVTSLVPFVAFPALGILDHKAVATAYGHTLILLLLGGFMLSTAMSASGAHRRVALGIIRGVGTRGPRQLVFGFMLATAFCSMWISNTATTLMLLPVALAVLDHHKDPKLALPLLLGIAYAASIGGMGTPVGTPPNVIFMGIYREVTGQEVSFLQWMRVGLPIVAVLLPIAWLWLTRKLHGSEPLQVPTLGPWTAHETRVLGVFAVTALLWVSRTAPNGGWGIWFPGVGDSTVALAAVIALFLIPAGDGRALVDWETANKIPWGLLLLFGGGIAIARAFDASKLSAMIGDFLATQLGVGLLPIGLVLVMICLVVTFLTEVTSNTATTTLLMPILAAASTSANLPPEWLMVPATFSASCAFMLPVATAPNAVIFGTDRVSTQQMARAGLALNLVGVFVVSGLCYLLLLPSGL
jgi:solute carrier family 13 (sodium-dependent dicarboxylate transporter), member 2/3/5